MEAISGWWSLSPGAPPAGGWALSGPGSGEGNIGLIESGGEKFDREGYRPRAPTPPGWVTGKPSLGLADQARRGRSGFPCTWWGGSEQESAVPRPVIAAGQDPFQPELAGPGSWEMTESGCGKTDSRLPATGTSLETPVGE